MREDQTCSPNTDSTARRAHGKLRNSIKTHRRSGGLAVFLVASAVALAAFSAASSAHRGSLGRSSRSHNRARSAHTNPSHARSATTLSNGDSARLLNEWTTCERTHGDPNQTEPTVDAHGVIEITIPTGAVPAGDPHDVTGTCSNYLAAARRALAGGQPVEGWGEHAKYLEFANCMRANGYPTYPYPSGIEPDGHESTNFNGTGINPESPAFLNGSANQTCGKQIGAPAWWINGWGPPGDITVADAGVPNAPPPCFFETNGCGAGIPVPRAGIPVPGASGSPSSSPRPPRQAPRATGPVPGP